MASTAQIAVINESTKVTDQEVEALAQALQEQITRDFAPIWGMTATVAFADKTNPPSGAWQLVALDNSDQAGALGYHDVTNENLPLGKFFVATCETYSTSWSVDASHELMEMLGDPMCTAAISAYDPYKQAWQVCLENCDACEDDTFGYQVNGLLLSDFVYPAWFGHPNPSGVPITQLDFRNELHTSIVTAIGEGTPAAALGVGGYIGVCPPGGQWIQATAERAPDKGGYATISNTTGGRFERRLRGASIMASISPDVRNGWRHLNEDRKRAS